MSLNGVHWATLKMINLYSLFFGVAATGKSGFLSWFEHIRETFGIEKIDDGGLIPLGFGICDITCSGISFIGSLIIFTKLTITLEYSWIFVIASGCLFLVCTQTTCGALKFSHKLNFLLFYASRILLKIQRNIRKQWTLIDHFLQHVRWRRYFFFRDLFMLAVHLPLPELIKRYKTF